MSSSRPRTGSGSMWGLRSMRRSEALRLAVAIALAAGAVALIESLTHAHHHSSASHPSGSLAGGLPGAASRHGGQSSAGASGVEGSSSPQGSSSPDGRVAVAGGPAVTRSLQHGFMTVVIDQPSSDPFAEQNRSITQGADVAVDELNAGGGLTSRHIHLKLLPQHLDSLSAGRLRSRLRAEAAAVLILPCDSESQSSLASAAAQSGTLMLAPCNPDPTAGSQYPTYWPVGTPANEEAAGLAKFMSLYGYQSAFVISTPGNRYFELLTSYFRSAAQKRGIQLTGSGSLSSSSPQFSSLASAIQSAPTSSAIFAAVAPPLVTRLAAVLAAQGVHRPIAGGAVMDTPRSLSRSTLENAFFPSNGFPRDSASARRFARDYTSRFHVSPAGSFPGLGLETIRLLEHAVHKAGSAQPSAIQRALAGGLALSGVGLADRVYQNGGDHNPVGQVDISKISARRLAPLVAITLP